MKITLCGSARFEKEYKDLNKRLTLAGHVVYSLSVYPSDEKEKEWYTEREKHMLDKVHLDKIASSDAIVVINSGGYIGSSTFKEIKYAKYLGKKVFYTCANEHPSICPYAGCDDPLQKRPCALCYE